MTIDQIINRLSNHVAGELPVHALIAASEQREALTPQLLEYLETIASQGDDIPDDQRVDLVFFAFYLLAQFREAQALPVMLRIISASPGTVNRLLGYVVSESLPRILASVMVGHEDCDIEPLQRLIENCDLHPSVRSSAITCLSILAAHGRLSREQLRDYFRELFAGKLAREQSRVWDGLVSNCLIAGFNELEESIVQALDETLLIDSFVGQERLSALLQEHPGEICFPPYEHSSLIDDCVSELKGWASFNRTQPVQKPAGTIAQVARPWPAKKQQPAPHLLGSRPPMPARNRQAPVIRENPKVGRNDPCPCGSGRKFKKCCGK